MHTERRAHWRVFFQQRVQLRYTRRLFDFYTAPAYDERLQILGLPSLNARREAADLTFAFKVLHGLIDADAISIGIQTLSSKTRDNEENLVIRRATSFYVAKSYTVTELLERGTNCMPQAIKTSVSLRTFKDKLWGHLLSYMPSQPVVGDSYLIYWTVRDFIILVYLFLWSVILLPIACIHLPSFLNKVEKKNKSTFDKTSGNFVETHIKILNFEKIFYFIYNYTSNLYSSVVL